MNYLETGPLAKIINIRGTSGSGKSTLVRNLMASHSKLVMRVHGRKQPIGYIVTPDDAPRFVVAGHYETACGGTDTIPNMDQIFELVRYWIGSNCNVVFEGLLSSAEFKRTAALHKDGYELHVIHIDIPLEVCLSAVEGRRWEAYQEKLHAYMEHCEERYADGKRPIKKQPQEPKPLNPKNTENKWKGTHSTTKRLAELGIDIFKGDREECYERAKLLLAD